MKRIIVLALFALALSASALYAQVPQTLSYQGVLLDEGGVPIADGTYGLTVRFYASADDEAVLWEESYDGVSVTGGVFGVTLGSVAPLDLAFDRPYWMGLSLGDDPEFTPRIPLTAAPYSLNSRAVVNEPAAGDSFAIRSSDGGTAHRFSPDGTAVHADLLTAEGGVLVPGDAPLPDPEGLPDNALPDDDNAALSGPVGLDASASARGAAMDIGLSGAGVQIGVRGASDTGLGVFGASTSAAGVQGQSVSGVGVYGITTSNFGVLGVSESKAGAYGASTTGPGVFGASDSAPGVAGQSSTGPGVFGQGALGGHFVNRLRLDEVPAEDSERILVWGSENIVKYRTLADLGGSAWQLDGEGNLVSGGRGVVISDSEGNTTTRFYPDGRSLHTGLETYQGGIHVRDEDGRLVVQIYDEGVTVFDPETGEVTSIFHQDGTSLNTGPMTFTGDVTLEGEGIKHVDENGRVLAGFGRTDLDTGERIGVFGRADTDTDLAGAFEGDVEFDGDIRIYDEDGNLAFEVKDDGTSYHRGLETFAGGLEVPLGEGLFARLMPETGISVGTADGEFLSHLDPNGNGYVAGDFFVAGTLAKGGGSFKIDHPLDPENRTLSHSFVESPDMMNVYNGTIALDANGEAVVELPAYFEALNRDFRYQLTCIGGFAPVYIAEGVVGNRFVIAGGTPGLDVSWQVTGVRQDAYAEQHRIPVEEDKTDAQRGRYLHPTVYGHPAAEGIHSTASAQRR